MKHNSIITRAQKNAINEKSNVQVKKEKSCAKKESQIPPKNYQVEEYFLENNATSQEAQKFINHYTANGWLVGGKTPMKDWQASARNWIANSQNFNRTTNQKNNSRANQLNTTTNKNYFEPL